MFNRQQKILTQKLKIMKIFKKPVILLLLTLFFLNSSNIYANGGDPTEREWMLFGTDTYEITNNCTVTVYERKFFSDL